MDAVAAPALPSKHIIDVLFEERAPHLTRHPFWPLLKPAIYAAMNYGRARQMADALAPLTGREAFDHVSSLLNVKLDLVGQERIPRTGAFLLLANHPTGITDGIALYDAIKGVRPDALFYANSDAHRVCPRFGDVLIPVEWVPGKRTRERTRVTLKLTDAALEAGKPIVVFPAGRVSRVRDGVLTDPEWMPTATSLARKYEAPVLPVHIAGPYSLWFHTLHKFSAELRDITLFHELLNKAHRTYKITFGAPIPPAQVSGEPISTTRRLKYYVERVLARNSDAKFDPEGPECAWRDPPKRDPNAPNAP